MTVPEDVAFIPPDTASPKVAGDINEGQAVSVSAIAADAGALYGLQAATYALPIITLTYLARVLGPAGLGLVAYGQSVGGYVNILIEYGFHLTLTREVARSRGNASRLTELLAAVWGAKAILALLAAPLLFGLTLFVNGYDVKLASIIFVWSASQSFNLVWYLHGTEQLRLASIFDATARILALIGIFLTVKRPEQIMLVFVWQAAGALLALVATMPIAYKGNKFVLPGFPMIRDALRLGWPMFVQNSCSQIYPSGNIVILGLLSSSAVVGLFSGPDRIIRGAVSLLIPLLYAAYPRVSRVAKVSPSRAASLAAVTVWGSIIVGVAASLVLFMFAPTIVRLALGRDFGAAVAITRILALIPFLRSITSAIALQWMMPFGYERQLAAVYTVSSATGLAFATLAALKWGAPGTACVTVVIEASIAVAQLSALQRGQFNPAKALWSHETRQIIASRIHLAYAKLS